jgi:hypothetical protein
MIKRLAVFLAFSLALFAALPAATVWEVRPATGNNLNGGGFVTGSGGTDYSQQTSPQLSVADAATTTTAIASVTGGFTAAMVGNIVQLSGGTCTAGFYEITVFTSTNLVTIDRTGGTGSACTANVGGALASVATAAGAAVSNNIIYFTGTYTTAATLTLTLGNGVAPGNPFSFIGYGATRTDGVQATWTTATNSTDLVDFTAASGYLFQNIKFTNTAAVRSVGLNAKNTGITTNVRLLNCALDGFTIGIRGNFQVDWEFQGLLIENTEIKNCTSHGVQNTSTTWILGSYIHDNAGDGVQVALGVSDSSYVIGWSIIYKNGANGVNFTISNAPPLRSFVIFNSVLSTNTGAGYFQTGPMANSSNIMWNVIIDNNGGFGIDFPAGTTITTNLNSQNSLAFLSNSSGNRRNAGTGVNDIALSVSPYVSIGTNFALNNTAGGGALLRGAGFPGILQVGGAGAIDVGALQHVAAAGAGQVGFGFTQ